MVSKDAWVQDPSQRGRIIGEVCHFVDTLRFLVKSQVQKVQAACIDTANQFITERDSVAITLTYADGSIGTILYYALGNSKFSKEYITLAADGSSVILDDYRKLTIYKQNKVHKFRSKSDKGHSEEIRRFLEFVAHGGTAPIPFDELYETTAITFAVHQALDTGKTISIPNLA